MFYTDRCVRRGVGPGILGDRDLPWPSPGVFVPAVAYGGVILGTYLLGVALGRAARGALAVHPVVFRPILFPVLFVYAVPIAAVVTFHRTGSLLGSLAVGLVPGLAFAILGVVARIVGAAGPGDAPLWALSLAFSGIGLAGALAGVLAYLVWTHLYGALS